MQERYDFMNEQRFDLEESITKLRNVISEMTTTMQKQFAEKFKEINKNFNEVFIELFGGGKAELILEDEANTQTFLIISQNSRLANNMKNSKVLYHS